MRIGGFQRFSLIDYPGKICAIVFAQGCNFSCPYCHNPELVNPEIFSPTISEKDVFSFLKERKGKLDAVSITGGEPTLQKDLTGFINKIKKMGFLVKMDSNGTNPDIVENIISRGIVDYLAMDVKAPLEKYEDVARVKVDTEKIKRSIELIKKSGIEHEFRTTVVKSQLSEKDITGILKLIKGANLYIIQKFVPSKTLDSAFAEEETYTDEEFRYLKNKAEKYVRECELR